MAWLFSKRYKLALDASKIRVSLPNPVRFRLWKALQRFDSPYDETDDTGWVEHTSFLRDLPDKIKSELGCKELLAWSEDDKPRPVPSDLERFVLKTHYPPQLFDALEIFYTFLPDEGPANFQICFNEIMEESGLSWRMLDGKIISVESAYIQEDITRKAHYLLKDSKFPGALEEFEQARINLANGEYKDAVDNANMAVESTMKSILGIEKAKPGELFRKIIESGLVPEYYAGFVKDFEKNILRCTAIIRNEELGVGHGQGREIKDIPASLAELAVNLSGVLISYLMKRHLENSTKSPQGSKQVSA